MGDIRYEPYFEINILINAYNINKIINRCKKKILCLTRTCPLAFREFFFEIKYTLI